MIEPAQVFEVIRYSVSVLVSSWPWFFGSKKDRAWKSNLTFVSVLVLVIINLLWNNYFLSKELDLSRKQTELTKSDVTSCKGERDRCWNNDTKGYKTDEKNSEGLKSAEEFAQQWDWQKSFYQKQKDIFCPTPRGGNNYQRMAYKFPSDLTNAHLLLKYSVVDEKEGTSGAYAQREVFGLKSEKDGYLTEIDMPSNISTGVNFRKNDGGRLIPSKLGENLPQEMKDGGVINLEYKTQLKLNNELISILDIKSYFSGFSQYGSLNKSFGNDFVVLDATPETAKGYLYFGSYLGGCLKIIGWNAY